MPAVGRRGRKKGKMPASVRFPALAALVLCLALLLSSCAPGGAVSGGETAGEPGSAPDFELHDQYGNMHRLSDYRGKIVFLNFWATWCPPCVNEMPAIQTLYEKYGEESGVVILGVAFPGIGGEESEDEVTEFLYENGFTYPVVMNPTGDLRDAYGIEVYPTTYTIDAEGKLSVCARGSLNLHMMEGLIQQTGSDPAQDTIPDASGEQ